MLNQLPTDRIEQERDKHSPKFAAVNGARILRSDEFFERFVGQLGPTCDVGNDAKNLCENLPQTWRPIGLVDLLQFGKA